MPLARFVGFNEVDLSNTDGKAKCSYTVHIRFDKTKVTLLGT